MTLTQAINSGKHCVVTHRVFGSTTQAHVAHDHGVLKFKVSDGDIWHSYANEQELTDTIDTPILSPRGGWKVAS